MKKSLFLYLFILAVLMNIFTYMYYSKKNIFDETQFKTTNTKLKDSLTSISAKLDDANYFALENNQNAKENKKSGEGKTNISYEKLIPLVKE